jgi:hypothetical protein
MFKSVLLAVVLTCVAGYLAISKFGSPYAAEPKNGRERKAALETPWWISQLASARNTLSNWPPVVGKTFPQFELFDHTGERFSMASLRGKPTIVEFISMSCAGCQAFAGGNEFGPFRGLASQVNLETFETYVRQYSGVDLNSGKVNFVIAVVYIDKLKAPTTQDLSDWRSHFQLGRHGNTFIVSSSDLANGASFKMIPGFMLLDQNQVVLFDSTGHHPTHNLYTELLPAVPTLLKAGR